MKRFLIAAAIAVTSATIPAFAADVSVSVSIGDPGFYGRIDIGGYPPPQVIYRQPRIIVREVEVESRPPIYLRVPPGHAKNWRKHCHKYNACGERVYFVQDNWYTHEYVPHYREQYRDGNRDDNHGKQKKDKKDKDKDKKDKGHGRDH